MAWRHGSSFRAGGAGIFNPAVRMFGEPPRLPGMCRATRRPLPAAKARALDTIKACCNSSRLFITNGPCWATCSPIGRPCSKNKRGRLRTVPKFNIRGRCPGDALPGRVFMATHLQTATTEKKQLTVIAWIRGGQRIACAYRHIDGPNYYPLTLVRRPRLGLWQWRAPPSASAPQ